MDAGHAAADAEVQVPPRGLRLSSSAGGGRLQHDDSHSSPDFAAEDSDSPFFSTLEAEEALAHARWQLRRKLKLAVMLLLLVLCGSAETVSYTVNGKNLMSPYRCFLDQAVVLTCIVFFAALWRLDAARKARRQLRCRAGSAGSAGSASSTSSRYPYAYHSMDDVDLADDSFSTTPTSPALAVGGGPGGLRGRRADSAERRGGADERQFVALVVVMASCDTVALYVNLLASHDLGGALRLIMQQSSIPLSMFFSYLLLGRTFSSRHLLGAFAVVGGILLCLVNVVKGGPGQQSSAVWSIAFAASCLPLALGGCLKEWVLVQPRFACDAHQLNTWVAVAQFFIGALLVPLGIWIQNRDMDATSQVHDGEILENFWAGFRCGFLGLPSYDAAGLPLYGKEDCGSAFFSTLIFLATVCSFNSLMLYIIQEGSAVLFFVGNGVIIPLVSALSASPLYEALRLPVDTYSAYQFAGLLLTVAGCLYFGMAVVQRDEEDQQSALLDSVGSVRAFRRRSRTTPSPAFAFAHRGAAAARGGQGFQAQEGFGGNDDDDRALTPLL